MNREDFPILNKNYIYFDNSATTLKPKCVVEAMNKYYLEYTSNIHRGDYDFAIKTNNLYDNSREIIKEFINCSDSKEVIFTGGTTHSINLVVFGFMKYYLKKEDEVLLSYSEHASNIIPWIELSREIGFNIKYIPLGKNHELIVENVLKSINKNTKVISIAHVSNVIGDVRDIESIGKICKDKNIIFNVDGAQSIPHMKVDFNKCNIDFLSFSGHKMCGPTGVGCLIGKYELLKNMRPIMYGGGMNNYFEVDGSVELKEIPLKFEAGTPPIAGIIGLSETIKYLNNIGMDNINKYEIKLKKYLVSELKKIDGITIYNENSNSGILAFNIDGVFAQDTSIYLNHYNICVRAGNHCAKILKDEIGIKNTVRVSLYFYNTKEEIDKFINVLKNKDKLFEIIL